MVCGRPSTSAAPWPFCNPLPLVGSFWKRGVPLFSIVGFSSYALKSLRTPRQPVLVKGAAGSSHPCASRPHETDLTPQMSSRLDTQCSPPESVLPLTRRVEGGEANFNLVCRQGWTRTTNFSMSATAFPVKLPSGLKIAPRQVAARGMLAIVISSATLPILERSLLTSHIISCSLFGCQGFSFFEEKVFLTPFLPFEQLHYSISKTRLPTINF